MLAFSLRARTNAAAMRNIVGIGFNIHDKFSYKVILLTKINYKHGHGVKRKGS
jgi:hypothetical protein